MTLREKWIKPFSLTFSVVLHLIILFFSLPTLRISSSSAYTKEYRIPVKLEMAQPKAEKAAEVRPKELPPVAKKAQARAKVAPKAAPTRQPGDRDIPGIIQDTAISPAYPKAALNNDLAGKILVECDVDEKGKVLSVTVLKSSGHKVLDDAFIRTVLHDWRFKPKRVLGKDVAGKVQLEYEFKID